ncbi:MAG: hypothetical protein ACR2NN_07165 [Bryobacteraceae bacterium]
MAKRKKPEKFDQKKQVRKLARERIGIVPGSRVIAEKPKRKKPKYRKPLQAGED